MRVSKWLICLPYWMTFWNAFSGIKCSRKLVPFVPVDNKSALGLVSNGRQAITWKNDYPINSEYMLHFNRMAWQWAETLEEIRGTLADIRGTTKLGEQIPFSQTLIQQACMFRSASLFIGTSFTIAVFTIFATSNVDSIAGIPHKIYSMQRILIHIKSRSLC